MQKFTIGPAQQGVWAKFTLHTKYQKNGTGLTEVYSDVPGGPGGPIVLVKSLNKPTMWNNSESIRPNYGYYREEEFSGKETFGQDGFTVATTREAAEASAFGSGQ
jgi:hypothetical protein